MEPDRYESLRQIEGWDQTSIRDATIAVVGVGALGNEVAKNLALLGVGHIALVDFDQVEISNLSRSVLFRASDRGHPKAEVAAKALRDINPDIAVLGLQANVTREIGLGFFRRMDVVLGCVDSVAARYHLNRQCWRVGVPWVEGGIAEYIGTVKVFQPPDGACYECTMSKEDRRTLSPKRISCSDPVVLATRPSVPTTPLTASVTGALMVQQALALLRGEEIGGRGWHFNVATGESLPLQFTRRLNCFSHDEHITQTIIEMPAFASSGLTLGDFLEFASTQLGSEVRLELGRSIVTRLTCPKCCEDELVWLDRGELTIEQQNCSCCQTLRQPEYVQSLNRNSPCLDRTLAALGIPPLDVLVASNGREHRFYELSHDVAISMRWA